MESLSVQSLFKTLGLHDITKEWDIVGKEKIEECTLGNIQINRSGRRGRTSKGNRSRHSSGRRKTKRLSPRNQVQERVSRKKE